MSKHTPGPWGWVYSDRELSRPIALSGDNRDVLTCSEDGSGPRGYVSPADARLIAAAPDLLAACQASVKMIAVLTPFSEDPAIQAVASKADAVRLQLREAIARATGEGEP